MKVYVGLMGMLFLFFSNDCFAQNNRALTLQDFKEGIFEYTDGPYKGATVTRTKKWQVEEFPQYAVKFKFRIDWVSDFEYHLTCIAVSDFTHDCMLGKIIKVKVLNLKDNGYTVLVQNGQSLQTVSMSMISPDPRDQNGYFRVMNSMNY